MPTAEPAQHGGAERTVQKLGEVFKADRMMPA